MVATLDPALQERWKKITDHLRRGREALPPRGRPEVAHPPVQALAGAAPAAHHRPVPGARPSTCGTCSAAPGPSPARSEQFAAASECADCHGDIFDEWAGSTMAHAATSTINEGQLPDHPRRERPDHRGVRRHRHRWPSSPAATSTRTPRRTSSTTTPRSASTATCPIGGSFTEDPLRPAPLRRGRQRGRRQRRRGRRRRRAASCATPRGAAGRAPGRGGARSATPWTAGSPAATYGTMFGPIFEDPNPLPVRIHGIETPGEDDEGFWRNDLETSQLCGACHNVKLDIDGDGLDDDRQTTPRSRASSRSSRRRGRRPRRPRRRRRLHPRRERPRRRPGPDRGRRGRRQTTAATASSTTSSSRPPSTSGRTTSPSSTSRRAASPTATPTPSSRTSSQPARLQRLPHALRRGGRGAGRRLRPRRPPDPRPLPPRAHLRRRRLRPRPRALRKSGSTRTTSPASSPSATP